MTSSSSSSSSFTQLLSSSNMMNNFDQDQGQTGSWNWGLGSTEQQQHELPKFSPTSFLSSPMFIANSNTLPSPTTGAFSSQIFDWMSSSKENEPEKEQKMFTDFVTSSSSIVSSAEESMKSQKQQTHEETLAKKIEVKSELAKNQGYNAAQYAREHKSDDGYNWRKYGQKQVKSSENPRSYYKCTFPNCPTTKKVERTQLDGHITQIVYKGSHNHVKPQSKRWPTLQQQSLQISSYAVSAHSASTLYNPKIEDSNSTSIGGDDEIEQISYVTNSNGADDENEPDAKRWKGENTYEKYAGNRIVKEPRIVVQTTSEIDLLDDGYRWRKYGQKVVKGNPNPRSYYKCTNASCPVRKLVERASHDMKAVITTYEGKHNHDVPAGRSGYGASRLASDTNSNSNVLMAAVRPLVLPNHSNKLSYLSPLQSQSPNTLKMLQNAGSYGFSDF